jgi:hypothetical protein
MHDQASGRVTLDITTVDGELVSVQLPDPELLLETLQNAICRKREAERKKGDAR